MSGERIDPTLAALERFRNPKAWAGIYPNIPVFVPHKIKDEHGKDIVVDVARLKKIASRINESFKKKGVPVKFMSGHTLPPSEVPQHNQPIIHAYGINAHVARWGPDQQYGLLLDMYVRPGHMKQVKELPFRSAEFYPQTNEITGVALLRTDPRLDMGVLMYTETGGAAYYDRNKKRILLYWESPMADHDPTMDDLDLDHDGGTADHDDDYEGDEGEGEGDEDQDDDGDEDDMEGRMHEYMNKHYPHLRQMHDEYAQQYGEGMPSGTNGAMPGADDEDQPQPYGRGRKPVKKGKKSKRPAQATPYGKPRSKYIDRYKTVEEARLEYERNQLKQQIQNERTRANLSECTRIVEKLIYEEGFFIANPDREIERMANMSKTERDERLSEIRQNYNRNIENSAGFVDTAGVSRLSHADVSPAEVNKVVQYGEANGIDTTTDIGFEKARQGYFSQARRV